MTARERLAEIKARAEAATEGPWEAWVDQFEGAGVTGPDAGRDLVISPPDHNINDGPDAEFIAYARTDIPRLVAALEAARGVINEHRTLGVEYEPAFKDGMDQMANDIEAAIDTALDGAK